MKQLKNVTGSKCACAAASAERRGGRRRGKEKTQEFKIPSSSSSSSDRATARPPARGRTSRRTASPRTILRSYRVRHARRRCPVAPRREGTSPNLAAQSLLRDVIRLVSRSGRPYLLLLRLAYLRIAHFAVSSCGGGGGEAAEAEDHPRLIPQKLWLFCQRSVRRAPQNEVAAKNREHDLAVFLCSLGRARERGREREEGKRF